MNDQPRDRHAFIITRNMWIHIASLGGIFFVTLLAFLYVLEYADVRQMTDLLHLHLGSHRGTYAIRVKFVLLTMFVMLQFWNMFNARALLQTEVLSTSKGCKGFNLIVLMILVGQILIVELGGQMFSVTPLSLTDWTTIIVASSGITTWQKSSDGFTSKRNRKNLFG